MSYSTQNLGSLMDDIGADEGAGGKAKARRGSSGMPFWKSQGFAIALAVVAVVVLAGGVYFSFFTGGGPKPPNRVMLVDVKTGELFDASTDRLILPAKNPATGQRNLFPVAEQSDGSWVISGHYLGGVREVGFNQSVVYDIDAGRVRIEDTSAEKYVKPGS